MYLNITKQQEGRNVVIINRDVLYTKSNIHVIIKCERSELENFENWTGASKHVIIEWEWSKLKIV